MKALKIAAATKDLEIVDVEPVPEYRTCCTRVSFSEARAGFLFGSLGFWGPGGVRGWICSVWALGACLQTLSFETPDSP